MALLTVYRKPEKGSKRSKMWTNNLHCTRAIKRGSLFIIHMRRHTCWPPCPPIKAGRGSRWIRIRLKDVCSSHPPLCCPRLASSSRVSFQTHRFLLVLVSMLDTLFFSGFLDFHISGQDPAWTPTSRKPSDLHGLWFWLWRLRFRPLDLGINSLALGYFLSLDVAFYLNV